MKSKPFRRAKKISHQRQADYDEQTELLREPPPSEFIRCISPPDVFRIALSRDILKRFGLG